MAPRSQIPFSCMLLTLCVLVPARVIDRAKNNFTEPQLPVFELHSGFWINLHHTLYQESRQRKAATSRGVNTTKSAVPAVKNVLAGKGLTGAEQKAWDDAVDYYMLNYADKDLLFTTELIQLKD